MRSVLATLGIVIGIVTVTLMGAAINGLDQAFIKSISSLGADVFYVSRNKLVQRFLRRLAQNRRSAPAYLARAKPEALARHLTLARPSRPRHMTDETVKYKTRSADRVHIIGTTDSLPANQRRERGRRPLPDRRGRRRRPARLRDRQRRGHQPVSRGIARSGKRIKIDDQPFQVVGVLEKQGNMFGLSLDNAGRSFRSGNFWRTSGTGRD